MKSLSVHGLTTRFMIKYLAMFEVLGEEVSFSDQGPRPTKIWELGLETFEEKL